MNIINVQFSIIHNQLKNNHNKIQIFIMILLIYLILNLLFLNIK